MKIRLMHLGICLALGLCMEAAFAQKAYIDPDTGELTTPPPIEVDELQQLQQTEEERSLEFSDEGLQVKIHPDGSESVDLQGRFQFYLHGTIDDTGKVMVDHQPKKSKESHKVPVKAVGEKQEPIQ
jgi:hypothetical protein